MKVKFTPEGFGREEKAKERADSLTFKFVVVGDEVRIFEDDGFKVHTTVLEGKDRLTGAGKIQPSGLEWGSSMCREVIGYDRPPDPREATNVLAEVRAAFLTWKQKIQ